MKQHHPSEFTPDEDVRDMNINLGKSRTRSEVISAFLRAVQNGSGTVFVPGFGTFAIAKTNKRETQ